MSRPDAPSTDSQLSASAFDHLLIELVPLSYRIVSQLSARDSALASQTSNLSLFSPRRHASRRTAPSTTSDAKPGPSSTIATTTAPAATEADEDEDDTAREAVFHRLDGQGYRVGQALAERFSPLTPRPSTPLDAIKFICKDLWTYLYKKQIDNLKTNHRGTFVLTDARFAPIARVSVDTRAGPKALETALRQAQPFLWWHCGVVRGALAALGVEVAVNAETQELPVAVFQVRVVGSKP
ncbi:trafficking protein particle complex subunit 6A [Myriangium duriaei CBS 260.36]|uniref:Trafficking protein particle complex subunit 6A n=1 Tax=Myriangium duriaei CBS 260.36 TaxID=1168546 RepID=A0A9P4MFI9_9PEZI|nr:trafficking protein particle complex subunit 6A [Myriangium duriaei CBS 260.36]